MTTLSNSQFSQRFAGQAPEVSIGVPVYNGEPYLIEALESLLQQTFTDFELIISDNASTDGTGDICKELASRDSRIRYVRQPRNVGAIRNWDFVALAANGTFFKWASANDRCDSTMLAKCVDALRREGDAVLCFGRTRLIDGKGSDVGLYEFDFPVEQDRPSERFICVRNRKYLNNAMSGLIRLENLKKTRLGRLYPHGDLVMMAELALSGKFRLLPDVLLYRRMDKGAASRYLSDKELRVFLDPEAGDKGLTVWRSHFDCGWSVLRAPVGWKEKMAAFDFVARSAYWDRSELWRELFGRTTSSVK
jgi:glycosyltransferase involved in cell wall biosynthesis